MIPIKLTIHDYDGGTITVSCGGNFPENSLGLTNDYAYWKLKPLKYLASQDPHMVVRDLVNAVIYAFSGSVDGFKIRTDNNFNFKKVQGWLIDFDTSDNSFEWSDTMPCISSVTKYSLQGYQVVGCDNSSFSSSSFVTINSLWNLYQPLYFNDLGHEYLNKLYLSRTVIDEKTGIRYASKFELLVGQLLNEMTLPFLTEYYFEDLRDKKVLRFDFAVSVGDRLALIECDGSQHFDVKNRTLMLHDYMKDMYCKNHDIPILRLLHEHEIKVEVPRFIRKLKKMSSQTTLILSCT